MSGFQNLIADWSEGLYSEPFYIFCVILALISSLKFVKKDKLGLLFIIYISTDLSISIVDAYLKSFTSISFAAWGQFIFITNAIIGLVELSVYYYFFYNTLNSSFIKKFIVATYFPYIVIASFLIVGSFTFLDLNFRYIINLTAVVEFILLLFLCLRYYIELFKIPGIELFERPSFFIATGIFFFSVISIPFYLISHFFLDSKPAFQLETYEVFFEILFYIPLSINFLMLFRSFICRKSVTI
jgi:hypothetical protein